MPRIAEYRSAAKLELLKMFRFVPSNRKRNKEELLMMESLINFLEEPENSEKDKVGEIKAAWDRGLITQDEAIYLACYYC